MEKKGSFKNHPKKLQYAAGFLVGLPILPFAIWASKHGANGGHLVTVLGSTFGTLLAVTGAVQIESWKRRLDKSERYSDVLSVIENAQNLLEKDIESKDENWGQLQARIGLFEDYANAFLQWSKYTVDKDVHRFDNLRYFAWAVDGFEKSKKSCSSLRDKTENFKDSDSIPNEISDHAITTFKISLIPIKRLKIAIMQSDRL